MSNIISNSVKFIGEEADVAKVMAFIKETDFDFDKIIPEPKEENMTPGESYEWRYDNWGTRSFAYAVEVNGNKLYFETINGGAIEVLEYISTLFPVKIEFHTYNHTDTSGYDGEIEAGEVIKCEYSSDYPFDDDVEDTENIEDSQEPSTQELMDDGLPF